MYFQLNSVYISRTYAGCLEGMPNNQLFFDLAFETVNKLWGNRKTIILKPKSLSEELPKWQYLIWFSGSSLKGGDGSELVVISFGDYPEYNLEEIMQQINWEAEA